MIIQKPRIYLYKITFEEVPYYYYGIHKERKFNEFYMGSPKTHKWCWEFYTPKKQLLELFEYSENGWLLAHKIEDKIIKLFLREHKDQNCLNAHYGGYFPKWAREKGNIKAISIFSQKRIDAGKRLAQSNIENGRQREFAKLGGKSVAGKSRNTSDETKLKRAKQVREVVTEEGLSKGGRNASKIKYRCLLTGHISTAPGLSNYQKARGINTTLRERIL